MKKFLKRPVNALIAVCTPVSYGGLLTSVIFNLSIGVFLTSRFLGVFCRVTEEFRLVCSSMILVRAFRFLLSERVALFSILLLLCKLVLKIICSLPSYFEF